MTVVQLLSDGQVKWFETITYQLPPINNSIQDSCEEVRPGQIVKSMEKSAYEASFGGIRAIFQRWLNGALSEARSYISCAEENTCETRKRSIHTGSVILSDTTPFHTA